MKKIFLILFLLLGCVSAQTFDPMQMPPITEYIQDFSNVLSAQQVNELRKIPYEYFSGTSTQIVTVLFPHRQGNELIDIGVKLFNENGIGQNNANNGLLLLIATEEKKIRIVVGYGLEGALPDLKAKEIVETIRPYINTGNYFEAIKIFYESSIKQIQSSGDDFSSLSSNFLSSSSSGLFTLLSVIFFIGGLGYGLYLPFHKKRVIPTTVKKFFGGKKARVGKIFLGIMCSYIFAIVLLGILVPVIDQLPILRNFLGGFFPGFGIAFLIALIPPGSFSGGGGSSGYSGSSRSSGSSSSSSFGSGSSSSSSSSSFSGGGGRTGGGGAGD